MKAEPIQQYVVGQPVQAPQIYQALYNNAESPLFGTSYEAPQMIRPSLDNENAGAVYKEWLSN